LTASGLCYNLTCSTTYRGEIMPDYQHILLDKDATERIAKLTLNRPERLNALNDLTNDELGDHAEGTAAIRESRKPAYEGR